MNSVDARAAFGDHVLQRRIHFEDLVHAEHVEQNSALERRADAHADSAFGDDRNLVLVGEFENLGDFVIARWIRLDAHDDIRQRAIGAVSERVLIVDLVDGIGRDASRTDDLLQFRDNLIEGNHGDSISRRGKKTRVRIRTNDPRDRSRGDSNRLHSCR